MGPKTKSANGKKKNDKKKNAEDKERLEIIKKLKMILKEYEKQCNKQGSSVDIKLKSLLLSHISDGKHLIRFVLQGIKPEELKTPTTNTLKIVKNKPDVPIIDNNNMNNNDSADTVANNNNIDSNSLNMDTDTTTSTDPFIIAEPEKVIEKPNEPPIKFFPLIKSLRVNWYKQAKELYFWDMDILREDVTELMIFLSQPSYNIQYLEILDCKINQYTLQDFSKCLSVNNSLASIVLDYTSLHHDGLVSLSSGLQSTKSVTKLSLCYCGLDSQCGKVLGDLVSQTTISEIYLDGNNLECLGIIDLLQMFVDTAEQESIERSDRANGLSQSAVGLFTANAPIVGNMSQSSIKKSASTSTTANTASKDVKKTKKRKKLSAKPKLPPRSGPWLNVLHAVNVGIDSLGPTGGEDGLLYDCLKIIGRWIKFSEDLKEIDLEDNLIGELGGREILDALHCRKEGGLVPIYIKVSHRMNGDVFKNINKLASGKSKRGGKKKKKKKKGGPGKRRV